MPGTLSGFLQGAARGLRKHRTEVTEVTEDRDGDGEAVCLFASVQPKIRCSHNFNRGLIRTDLRAEVL
jgi:hypothetical protein